MNGHHLILGELVDFITGKPLADTHDERYRQKLARLLVNHKGFSKREIQSDFKLKIRADQKKAIVYTLLWLHQFYAHGKAYDPGFYRQ